MNRQNQVLLSIMALCFLSGAIYLTVALISPPMSLPVDAPATEFSAGRAMQDLEIIAREPRPMGVFQAHADVRDYLLGEIRELDLEPHVQRTFGVRPVSPGWTIGGAVENVLVRLPGTDPEGAILLIAHYDSTPGGPGAADNGAGVVTILEVLRSLRASPPLRQDVVFLFTDGHEPGIIGTHAFTAQHPWFDTIKLVINIDGVTGGPPVLAHNEQGNDPWIPVLARTAGRPAYISLPTHLFPAGENDLIPFRQAGVTGVSFGLAASVQETHTALDRPEIVKPGTVQQNGNHILALVRYLGDQPTLELDAPEQTFFPVLGRLVHYASGWVMPLAGVAGLCFLVALFYGFHKRRLTWKGMGLGFLTFLICLALGVGIANLLWLGIQTLHPEYEYSAVRPHLSDDHLYAIGFFVLTLVITSGIITVVRKKVTALDLAAGVLVVWFTVVVAATILVPATSYLATWVLLADSLALLLALLVHPRKDAWVLSGLGFLVSAILATFLWIPVIYIAFLGTGFTMMWMMIGLAALWSGAILPALDWITQSKRWPLPATALLIALGFLFAGHLLVGRSSPPPLVNSIGYWLDTDSNEANWVAFVGGIRTDARTTTEHQVAFPEEMDERQTRLLVNPVRRSYTELFPEAPGFSVLTSEAPLLAQEGPSLEVITDEWTNNHRVVTIRITTSMHDRLYIVIPDTPLLAITVPNNERIEASGTEWWLRFDGMPVEGIEMRFEFSTSRTIQFLLVEENTGLPSFSGFSTQPQLGTMRSPGEFLQGLATDFTAIYRRYEVPAFDDG